MATNKTRQAITRDDLGWLASAIDISGSISLGLSKPNSYNLRISLASTSRHFVERVQEVTGLGKVNRRDLSNKKRMTNWEWRVFTNDAVHILKQVEHRLIIKAPQAAIAIRHQEAPSIERIKNGKAHFEQIKRLNSRERHREAFGEDEGKH